MLIPEKLAQHIVDSAQAIIRCNVNIMDREGIIVGTAQPERRRSFHKGAKDVIETGNPVEIRGDDLDRYPGALPGVNLPISLEGQIIGVIGVTGDPDKVRDSARLIKMITELILEREFIQQGVQSRQRLAEQFVELLVGGGSQYTSRITRAAKALGLDLEIPRLAAVADLSGLLRSFYSEYGPSELVLERSTEAILKGLHENGSVGDEDVAVILDERLIILKSMPESQVKSAVFTWGEKLMSVFEAWGTYEVSCGAGGVALSLDEYPLSYRQARFCLRCRESGRPFKSIYASGLSAGYLLEQAATGPAAMALRPFNKSLKSALAAKPELETTLRALMEHNFEHEATAHALGIHRNTLTYRMSILKRLTGLEPARLHDDAVILKALLGR